VLDLTAIIDPGVIVSQPLPDHGIDIELGAVAGDSSYARSPLAV
jgi:hypothetical protein